MSAIRPTPPPAATGPKILPSPPTIRLPPILAVPSAQYRRHGGRSARSAGPAPDGRRRRRRAAPTVIGNYEKGKVTAADKTADQSRPRISDVGDNDQDRSWQRSDEVQDSFGAAPHERPVPRISIHAFCEFPDTGAALQRAGADRRLSKAHLTVQLGGINAAVDFYHGQVTPNLLIVETRLQRPGRAGRTRPPGRSLRSRHQSGRGRPHQRRRALSRIDAPRRVGISGGAAVAAAVDRSDFRSLSGSRRQARSAASSPLSARAAARALPPSPTMSAGASPRNCTSTPPSWISTCRSAPRAWISMTRPARASPMRCRRRNGWTMCCSTAF